MVRVFGKQRKLGTWNRAPKLKARCGDSCQWKQCTSRHWILRWSPDPDGLLIILIFIAGHAFRLIRRFVCFGSLRADLATLANVRKYFVNGN
jgi:hypothetical protein